MISGNILSSMMKRYNDGTYEFENWGYRFYFEGGRMYIIDDNLGGTSMYFKNHLVWIWMAFYEDILFSL